VVFPTNYQLSPTSLVLWFVDAPFGEGVASYDAPGCLAEPSHAAIFFYRLLGVLRTAWWVPTEAVWVFVFEHSVVGGYGALICGDEW